MSENNFHDGDIVTYPIHENTKNQRLTIGKLSGAGITFWIDGPEISTTVSDISKCTLIAKASKKADKIFKKYNDRFKKLDMDTIGFEVYQSGAECFFEMYKRRFEELENGE